MGHAFPAATSSDPMLCCLSQQVWVEMHESETVPQWRKKEENKKLNQCCLTEEEVCVTHFTK